MKLSKKQALGMTDGQLINEIIYAHSAEVKRNGLYIVPEWAKANVKVCCEVLRQRGLTLTDEDEKAFLGY